MHEGDEVRADIGDLTQSALQVARCGEDMAAAHTAADVRVDSALAGWQGLSAAALTGRVAPGDLTPGLPQNGA